MITSPQSTNGNDMKEHNKTGSITISYGMPKSASTFAWMLIKDFLIASGHPVKTLSNSVKGNRSVEDYVTDINDERFKSIKKEIADKDLVLKTHSISGRIPNYESFFLNSYIFIQHRDPREIVLSLIDHGARSRKKGIKDFAECVDIDSSLNIVDHAMNAFFSWTSKPSVYLISYEQLCFNTKETISRLKEIYATESINVDALLSKYEDKNTIIQFNKGVRNRWEDEMSSADSEKIIERYSKYYEFVKRIK